MRLKALSITLFVVIATVRSRSTTDLGSGKAIDDTLSFDRTKFSSSTLPPSLSTPPRCDAKGKKGVHVCVRYFECDTLTNTVNSSSNYKNVQQFDVRFGEYPECEPYLHVCCKLPSSERTRPGSLKCGIRNKNGIDGSATGKNSNQSEFGEFPWMVALFGAESSARIPFCGGSLITPNVVLTAAHCVKNSEINVRAGEWDLRTQNERLSYQERIVSRVIIHEDYHRPVSTQGNVALLILNSAFDFAEHIGTICLPKQDDETLSGNCLSTGWGSITSPGHQPILNKVQLPIVPTNICERTYQELRNKESGKLNSICAGGEEGKGSCWADGGGPLTCPDPSDSGRYVQAGIVSHGKECGQKDVPAVYTNVARYRNWIDQKLTELNIESSYYTV